MRLCRLPLQIVHLHEHVARPGPLGRVPRRGGGPLVRELVGRRRERIEVVVEAVELGFVRGAEAGVAALAFGFRGGGPQGGGGVAAAGAREGGFDDAG